MQHVVVHLSCTTSVALQSLLKIKSLSIFWHTYLRGSMEASENLGAVSTPVCGVSFGIKQGVR